MRESHESKEEEQGNGMEQQRVNNASSSSGAQARSLLSELTPSAPSKDGSSNNVSSRGRGDVKPSSSKTAPTSPAMQDKKPVVLRDARVVAVSRGNAAKSMDPTRPVIPPTHQKVPSSLSSKRRVWRPRSGSGNPNDTLRVHDGSHENDPSMTQQEQQLQHVAEEDVTAEPTNEEPPSRLQSGQLRTSQSDVSPLPGAYSVLPASRVQSGRYFDEDSLNEADQGNDGMIEYQGNPSHHHHVVAAAEILHEPTHAVEITNTNASPQQLEETEKRHEERTKRLMLRIGAVFLLFVIAAVVIVVVLITRDNGSSLPDATGPAPSGAPSFETQSPTAFVLVSREYVVELVQLNSPTTTFEDDSSPQTSALEWVLVDPFLKTFDVDNVDRVVLQRFALATFYIATNRALAGSWLDPVSACEWEGLNCTGSTGIVDVMDMDNVQLEGTLPDEMGLLTALTHLSLVGCKNTLICRNSILGTVPSQLGWLSEMTHFDLSGNKLQGTIPTEFGNWTSVTNLLLNDNELQGSIPTEIGLCTDLTVLNLSNNTITGTTPTALGRATALKALFLDENRLEGTIPTEIGQWTTLEFLHLRTNELVGVLPSEIGLMTALVSLVLNDNKVEGSIPSEIGLLTELASMNFESNALQGTIPSEIGLLVNLDKLDLSHNENLSGSIPTELSKLTGLYQLWVQSTNLSGPLPLAMCGIAFSIRIDCDKVECTCELKNSCGCG